MEKTASNGPPGGDVILAATDFSPPADEALRRAHTRAAAEGAQLVVCHIVPDQLQVNMLFPQRSVAQGKEQLELEARVRQLIVERTIALTGRTPEQFEAVVAGGTPYSAIVELAEQKHAALIVLGERGAAGLSRILLGSVASRVVRYAHCPVLVARAAGRAQRILVATDLSDPSLPALGAAAAEARRTGARVTALYCLEYATGAVGPEYGATFAPAPSAELIKEMRENVEKRLRDAAQRVELVAELRVVDNAAVPAIVDTAEEIGADLVVVGTRGRTGLRRMVLGSVAEAVIRAAPCSVLAVRHDPAHS